VMSSLPPSIFRHLLLVFHTRDFSFFFPFASSNTARSYTDKVLPTHFPFLASAPCELTKLSFFFFPDKALFKTPRGRFFAWRLSFPMVFSFYIRLLFQRSSFIGGVLTSWSAKYGAVVEFLHSPGTSLLPQNSFKVPRGDGTYGLFFRRFFF